MDIPPYLTPRPPMPLDEATRDAFDTLFARVETAGGERLGYDLTAPIWQFFSYIADTRPVLLHGSGDPDIVRFEPRKSHDVGEFGDRTAVYAAGDGLWPMYFAIIDRPRVPMTIMNSSIRIELADGTAGEPLYLFSITDKALAQRAFRTGTVYILPRETFEPRPPLVRGDARVHVAEWASLVPVAPLAKFWVTPGDFPLLDNIRGHDDEVTFSRARANPAGFPWVED